MGDFWGVRKFRVILLWVNYGELRGIYGDFKGVTGELEVKYQVSFSRGPTHMIIYQILSGNNTKGSKLINCLAEKNIPEYSKNT